jgi:hypothetical protein
LPTSRASGSEKDQDCRVWIASRLYSMIVAWLGLDLASGVGVAHPDFARSTGKGLEAKLHHPIADPTTADPAKYS